MKLNLKKYACLLIALVLALSTVFVGGGITASANHEEDSSDGENTPSNNSRVAGGPIFNEDFKDDGGPGGNVRDIIWEVPDEHKNELSKLPGYNGTSEFITTTDIVTRHVSSLPNYLTTTQYNDIDTLLCVLRYMEDYYYNENLAQQNPNEHYEDLYNDAIGFIRSLHEGYANNDNKRILNDNGEEEEGLDFWLYVAGELDGWAIDRMRFSEQEDLLYQYFYRFAPEGKFNNYIYDGTIPNDLADKDLYPQYAISDPLGSGQSIDLLHMFASLDGVFEHTGRCLFPQIVVDKYTQKDLASWLGDLHTLTKSFSDNVQNVPSTPMFNENYVNYSPEGVIREITGDNDISTFSYSDLLADIDAFNIATIILNCRNLRLIDAIALYYNIMPNDSEQYNRYTMFVYCSTLQTHRIKTGNMITDFKNEVYSSLNLKITDNSITDHNYINFAETYLLKGGLTGNIPSVNHRSFIADIFYNYIISKANLD